MKKIPNKKFLLLGIGFLAVISFAVTSYIASASPVVPGEPTNPTAPTPPPPTTPTPPSTQRKITVTNVTNGTITGYRGSAKVINCGSGNNICTYTVPASRTAVTITFSATPANNYALSAWGGNCSGTPTTTSCSLQWLFDDIYNASVSASYVFTGTPPPPPAPTYNLAVQLVADGSINVNSGVVTTTDASAGIGLINCGKGIRPPYCQTNLPSMGKYIRLNAIAASGYTFSKWSGTGIAVDYCFPATTPTCKVVNDGWGTATGTLSANFAKIVPVLSGQATATLTYANVAANTATVYLTWPSATLSTGGSITGITYYISRNGTSIGSTTSLSYYDTSAPTGSSVTYTITAKDGSGNTIGTLTSNPVNLKIILSLSGYAWANANSVISGGSAAVAQTNKLSWNSNSTPFGVTASVTNNSVTLTFSEPSSGSSQWKQGPSQGIYRCQGTDEGCYFPNPKTPFPSPQISPGGSYTFTDSNLQPSSHYIYDIFAQDQYGSTYNMFVDATTSDISYQGIGWVKFASDSSDAQPFGVYVDSNNNLSGYAWSGMECPSGQTGNCGYGWLSFNESDASHQRGSFTGAGLTDWARFLTFANGNSSWDGWVSLGGISYDPSTKMFSGKTPTLAVDVLGQMSFCDPNNGTNYCVTGTPPPQPPQNVSISNTTYNSFTVNWKNPQSYPGGIEFHVFDKTTPTDTWFNLCTDATNNNCFRARPSNTIVPLNGDTLSTISTPGNHSAVLNGFSGSNSYGVFVRGILH